MTRIPLISAAIVATLGLAACEPTAPSTPGSNVPTGPYVLVGIGSDTVPQRNVGMTIEADGSISGQAPCNNYTAPQTAEPPGFALGALTTTKMGCSGRAGQLESRYFQALSGANGIAYEGGVLTIKGPTYLTYEPGYRKEK
ncbi:META domain-containing protein [Paracoccus sp. TOH]|uniref:META domain-containing protein n=1 Tax=Paracoccus sp. TOH TaxID=1263728 RepID=UPI0025AF7FA9|nr:META domain-containing protein [Paracoccus sp. TOH]WJS84217.1 META domain-containing protein [Paracoccus sp. TOH]